MRSAGLGATSRSLTVYFPTARTGGGPAEPRAGHGGGPTAGPGARRPSGAQRNHPDGGFPAGAGWVVRSQSSPSVCPARRVVGSDEDGSRPSGAGTAGSSAGGSPAGGVAPADGVGSTDDATAACGFRPATGERKLRARLLDLAASGSVARNSVSVRSSA